MNTRSPQQVRHIRDSSNCPGGATSTQPAGTCASDAGGCRCGGLGQNANQVHDEELGDDQDTVKTVRRVAQAYSTHGGMSLVCPSLPVQIVREQCDWAVECKCMQTRGSEVRVMVCAWQWTMITPGRIGNSTGNDILGASLDPKRVKKARAEGKGEFHKHEVYTKVPTQIVWMKRIKKSDDEDSEYRSRLVAKQIKRGNIFGMTCLPPPLLRGP